MITIDQLWAACDRIASDRGARPQSALEPAGIYLVRPLERFDCDYTPANSITFACTGMDAELFGLLAIEGAPLGAQPVVMSVPRAFGDGIDASVIAEDLEEFLRLGSRVGWWMLPDLVRDPDDVLALYRRTAMDCEEANGVLRALRDALGLTPAPLDLARLAALDARYGRMMAAPPRHRA